MEIQTNIPYNPIPPKSSLFHSLTGRICGRLTVIAFWAVHKKASHWLCHCRCGVWKVVSANRLRSRQRPTNSCGCLARETTIARSTIHGEGRRGRRTPEYEVYKGLRKRCNNKHCQDYPDYGGRGIECKFTSYQEFLGEVGRRPSSTHKIDRIDNDGHYEIGNVKWSTDIESANNKRNNHRLTFNGQTKTLPDWARAMNLTPTALRHRIERGWDVGKALLTPMR